jgi:ATP-dependent Clp protease adapter protein ClpS
VVLHDDQSHSFDHVIRALRKVFGYGVLKASCLALRAHCSGRSRVWRGHREHAELKAEQLRTFGLPPGMLLLPPLPLADARPLRVTIEPMPVG